MSYNKVILIGNVGKDPEVKYFDTKNCVANFTLATNEGGYTKTNGEQVAEQTDWHNITAFRELAKFVEKHVRKGTRLLVEGRLKYRTYVDSMNIRRVSAEVVADRVQFCGLGSRPQKPQDTPEKPEACLVSNEIDTSDSQYDKYREEKDDLQLPF